MNQPSLETLQVQGIVSELKLPEELRSRDVCVWAADLLVAATLSDKWRQWLAPEELERAGRFVFLTDQERFVSSRGALRILLGHYMQRPPEQVQFAYHPKGKPFVQSMTQEGGLAFNLSHSAHVSLIAISGNRNVGVDIECIRAGRDLMEMAQSCFAPPEQALLRALSAPERAQAFYQIWTRKEAVLKGIGLGITSGLQRPDVSNCLQGGLSSVHRVVGPDDREWLVHGFKPRPEFEAAIAVAADG